MKIDEGQGKVSESHEDRLFPMDPLGRIACVLVGVFFSVLGIGSLAVLVSNRQPLGAIVVYELSVLASLSGLCFLLWGLFSPRWLRRIAHRVVAHFLWVIIVLFLPFAIQAIFVLLSGKV